MKGHVTRFIISVAMVALFAGCSVESKKARLLERAEKYFQAADYEKAEIEYLNVLQLDQENTSAIEHLGQIWIERGSPVRAIPFLQKIRLASPNNRQNQQRLLEIMLSMGKLGEARKEAEALLRRFPDDKEAILVLAHAARSRDDQKAVEEALKKADQGSAAYHLATAHLHLRRGDTAGARTALLRARGLEPKSPKVHAEMAAYHLAMNQRQEATESLKAAAELAPLRSNDQLRYAEFLMQSGSIQEASAMLKAITEKAPDYLPAWRGLAYIAMAEKKFDDAQAFLEKIFRRDPSNYEARIARAKLALTKGETKRAIEELEQLGSQFPALAEDKFVLGQVYLQSGDSKLAATALSKALTQNPNHEAAILLLARLKLAAGEAEPVVRAMSGLLAERPNMLPAQVLLLEALRALGRLEEVAEGIRKQIQGSPDRVELHRLLGLVLKQQGKPAEARRSLERSLELTPDFLPVVTELISLDLEEKNHDAAMQRVRRQLAQTPDLAAVHFLEARVLAAQGNWELAAPSLFKTLELDSEYTPAYDLLSNALAAQKPSPQIIERVGALVAKNPGNMRAALIAGNLFLNSQQFDQARDVYEKHLSAKPESAAVLNNLAVLYQDNLNQPERALELARKARKLEPASPAIADTLGWVLFKRKEYAEALELFKESAAKFPKVGEIQYHLGLANQALGHAEAARAAFQTAAQAPEKFPGKENIAQKLAELGEAPAATSSSSNRDVKPN